jgi:hypothetical protein
MKGPLIFRAEAAKAAPQSFFGWSSSTGDRV